MSDSIGKNNKWALLIGINKYKYMRPLQGCINDVKLMAKILEENFGFPKDHITQLNDEQATYNGIKTAFQELFASVSTDNIVIIHYSGHGSRMTDREGDKPDGMDETIVPYDSGRYSHENRDIADDELYDWLLRLSEKTPYITLIFDSCHSGGIVRDSFGTSDRWVEPDTRPIQELPPSPVAATLVSRGENRDFGSSGWLPISERYVLIAGCSAEEKASEHLIQQGNGKIDYGALTYFLCQELCSAKSGITYRDVFERSSAQVTAKYPFQHPQMEGARDRELFNVHDIRPMRFLPIQQRREDNRITLGGGAAHGLTVDSQWVIYPSGTQQITQETPRLGMVEITSISAVTSEAEIIEENDVGAIIPGSRAIETAHFYGEMRLRVDIQVPTDYKGAMNELVELISYSALLRQAQEGEVADARIYIIAPRTEVNEGVPVPQLRVITKPTWAVVGQNGQLIMPTHTVEEAGAVTLLHDNLEKIVRYQQALALKNPDLSSSLNDQVKFDLNLRRRTSDGTWVEAQPDYEGGLPVFEEGDRIEFEIVNLHHHPIYVSILDFGLTYAINPLYPVVGANQQFLPSKFINIGIRQGQQIELYLPNNFPYISPPNDHPLVRGTETFKLFATTHPADFSSILQGGLRRNYDTLLEQLLDMTLTGNGEREARPINQDEDWTTVERSFFLQARIQRS
ncbi:MAG: caspase family protein [Scytonema sp. PMC 1069.18]|nr:caspase family protein [Scytonema sp. PMC 1069.18]MEC4880161.1 caspase family protein [Scytonema sp. PMC 1070.18]